MHFRIFCTNAWKRYLYAKFFEFTCAYFACGPLFCLEHSYYTPGFLSRASIGKKESQFMGNITVKGNMREFGN